MAITGTVNPLVANPSADLKIAVRDVDLTPKGKTPSEAYQNGRKYAEAMRKKGNNVIDVADWAEIDAVQEELFETMVALVRFQPPVVAEVTVAVTAVFVADAV